MLKKIIFKDEVKKILLEYILTGSIKPGERISLPAMAKELELSVTPIREALTQLSETGIVVYIANRGFFVMELSLKEAEDIYALMAVLEGNAVRNSHYNTEQIQELRTINSAFINAKNAIEMLDYDRLFHQKLIETYTNATASKIIENLRVRISLYDYAFWNEEQKMTSIAMHERIILLLVSNDITSAVNLVEDNWIQGAQYIIDKYEKNQSK
ncbi:GntR family transcriptional regulator [Winogradskyella luteola]|uniref:GntR family transcriptional regulator n=1 Tax=Winogradskyella luteola TaxID=2828330 RepID=A0A9X1F6Z1_9FLAO|nr:GntR family transcriptional regulator [Winogradskyella luteola]MBV7267573.1 GntR family transcriptional regulator [Winogradskyella luteola]